MNLDAWRDVLACPACRAPLSPTLGCERCRVGYGLSAGVCDLVPESIARCLGDGAGGWDRWQEAIRGLRDWRARRVASGAVRSSIDHRVVSLIEAARPSGFVVDVGGADGAKLQAMPEGVSRYLSVDPCAAAMLARRGCEWLSVRAVAEALPLADGVADVVLSVAAMDYFVDPARAVGEFWRVLRKGGVLALLVTVHPAEVARVRARASRIERALCALSPSVVRSVGARAALSLALDGAGQRWREHTRYLTEDSVLSWLTARFEPRSIARDRGSYSTVIRFVGSPKGFA